MNKRLATYFLFFALCFSWHSIYAHNSEKIAYTILLVEQDSLYIDKSNVQPRHFENLKDKYQGEEFVYEYTIENSGWWSRFKQWLSDLFKSIFDIETQKEADNITGILLKIGGVIIFLLVIYFIFKAVMNDEGSWVFGKSSDKNIIPVTDIEQNLSITDFGKLTKEAENNNEYRLAVRYYYLWLLKKLTLAEIIEYDVEKTNSDYQNEITITKIKDDFSYTSYLYNYIWYGEFDVNQKQYDKAKNAFTNFLNTIKT